MSPSTSPTTVPPTSTGTIPGVTQTGTGTFFNTAGGVGAPSVSGSGSPLISQDQSGFSQYGLNQISTNPVLIGNLPGIAADQPTTIGSALNDFMNMSPAQLQQIEMMLWDAGYYIDGNGQPISAQDIRFGVPGDPASWTAFTRALGAAASSGVSLTQLLQTRAGQGAGQNMGLPSPVTGGGKTYSIDLSNPTSVKFTADQIFQAALGRNATAAEVESITSSLRSQQTAQGLTQEQGAEQQSRAAYQAQVNQRNIAYESETNPNLGGPIPTGPFNDPQSWASALLSYMNMPVTTSNVAALTAWANQTGKFNDGSFNPLGTERPEGGSSSGPGGVQKFQNWAQGLEGTASMLMNGKYQALVSALQNGNASDAVKNDTNVKQELSSWSKGQIGGLTVDSQTTQAAAAQAAAWNNNPNQPAQQGGMTLAATTQFGTAQSMGAEGGGPTAAGMGVPGSAGVPATAQSMGAEGGGPGAGSVGGTDIQSVSPTDVSQGQQPPNPGDTYINPVTVYDVSPASEEAQAYQEATTGANRIPYAGNTYLKLYNNVLSMIKAGGPTG